MHVALAKKVIGGGLGVLGGEVRWARLEAAAGGGGSQSSVRGGWRAWRKCCCDVCFPDGSQPAIELVIAPRCSVHPETCTCNANKARLIGRP